MSDEIKELRDQIASLQEKNRTLEDAYLKTEAQRVAGLVSTDADLTSGLIGNLGEVMHLGAGRVQVVARDSGGQSLMDYARTDVVQRKLGQFAKHAPGDDTEDDHSAVNFKRPGQAELQKMRPDEKIAWLKAATDRRRKQRERA